MLGAASSFPASPNTADTCFRSDLGAWFRYDGTAWQQMGLATFTTAARPAAPPTGFRYFDTTANAVYRWTGSAYVSDPLAVPADIATATAGVVPLTVENTNVTPTADLQDWKANGVIVTSLNARGVLTATGIRGGTTFPASPASGDVYFRSDLGGWWRYNGTAWVQMGARVKIMEYNASTDLMSATAIAASTWTDICANQSFTVDDALAPVEIILNLGLLYSSATAANEAACALLIDGTTRYQISANVVGAVGTFAGLAGGSVNIGTLTAAAHTVKVQINSISASTGYLRASSDPTWEFLRLQVFENHP
jgi:hypothetical protein